MRASNLKFLLFLGLFWPGTQLQARVFFVGSNPHLTVFAFPQDIYLVPGDFAYYYISYQTLPWWSDIDDPMNKPSDTYTATGEKVVDSNGAAFEFNSAIYNNQHRAGFSKMLDNGMKTRFDLFYTMTPMRTNASGASPGGSTKYNYKARNSIHDIYLQSILALKKNGIPIGFKFGFGSKITREPHLDFTIRRGGSTNRSNRLLWGWSLTKGDNVVGDEAYGLARYQDKYRIGPLHRFDLQTAATIPYHKLGIRFRFLFGSLDEYKWDEVSQYALSENAQKIRSMTIRPYANFTWIEKEKYRFSTLALARYTKDDSIEVLANNSGIKTGEHRRAQTFVFQVNPNINVYPWRRKMTYIDAAILCNASHARYDNRKEQNISGGKKLNYIRTSLYEGEDYSWLQYSYARRSFFEIALDIHSVFPFYGGPNQRIAGGLSLLLWTRFKWFNKYHGNPATSSNDIDFDITGIRKNYHRETWVNSVWNFFYSRGGYHYRLDIGQPLIYSLIPRTRATDGDGKIIYEKKKRNMWVSQGGLKLGLFVATSLDKLKTLGIPGFNTETR